MFETKKTYFNREADDRALVNPVDEVIVDTVRQYRLGRIRDKLAEHDCAGILLYDPLNIRYATDASNMQVWTLHNAARYCMVMADGPVILWEFHNCEHLADGLDTVDEVRLAKSWFYFAAGDRMDEYVKSWSGEIKQVVDQYGGGNTRLAIDKLEPQGTFALSNLGLELVEGQELTEHARKIKSAEELVLMDWTIKVCEEGMWRMRAMSQAGRTENEIWAELHFENIRNGGEWIETRLLASGPRTNPWFKECSNRVCETGDILAFDTDMIGPYGYCSDISRTWTIDHTAPSDAQLALYAAARQQIEHNRAIIRPGMSFAEFNDKSWRIPDIYRAGRYGVAAHGVGLCDEWPAVPTHPDFHKAHGGMFEEGMVVCVESYIGAQGGKEGVKLEIQCLVTQDGARQLDTFPFEDW